MDSLPSTSPHFIGLTVAVVGMFTLAYLLTVDAVIERLGKRKRLVVVAASVGLLATALFGNGVYGTAGHGTVWSGALLSSNLTFSQVHVNNAVKVGLSDDFIAYEGQLRGEKPVFKSADFDSRLKLSWRPFTRQQTRSGTLPNNGFTLFYQYYDTHNILYELLGIGTDAMDRRQAYWNEVVHKYLKELIALEYFENTTTDTARIAALRMLRTSVVYGGEWIVRALNKADKSKLSAPVRAELQTTLAYAQEFIDEPTRRGLAKNVKVTLK